VQYRAIKIDLSVTTDARTLAGVAQLVEQRIRNAKVGCSIHLTGTKNSLQIYWFKAVKACFAGVGGPIGALILAVPLHNSLDCDTPSPYR
jgi:hypothetical protein